MAYPRDDFDLICLFGDAQRLDENNHKALALCRQALEEGQLLGNLPLALTPKAAADRIRSYLEACSATWHVRESPEYVLMRPNLFTHGTLPFHPLAEDQPEFLGPTLHLLMVDCDRRKVDPANLLAGSSDIGLAALFTICLDKPQAGGPRRARGYLWRTEQEVQTLLAGIGQELTQPAKPDDADNSEGKSQLPRVPSRRADWQQWHVTWLKVRSQWEQGEQLHVYPRTAAEDAPRTVLLREDPGSHHQSRGRRTTRRVGNLTI